MLLIVVLWYFLKHLLARSRQTPYQRGIYEQLFHDLATDHPTLWSRTGPRDYIIPSGLISRLKWPLIKSWSVPSKTIRSRPDDLNNSDDLGTWSKIKRYLTRKWTAQMHVQNTGDPSASTLELGDQDAEVATGVAGTTELFTLPSISGMNGTTEQTLDNNVKILLHTPSMPHDIQSVLQERIGSTSSHPPSRDSNRPPSPDSHSSPSRNSGVMIEEEEPNWLKKALHNPPRTPKERSKSPKRPGSKGSEGDSKSMVNEGHVGEGGSKSMQDGLGVMGSGSGFAGGL